MDPTPIRRRVRFSLETTPGVMGTSAQRQHEQGGYHTSFNHRTKLSEATKPMSNMSNISNISRFQPLCTTAAFGSPITPPTHLQYPQADEVSDIELDSDLGETETDIITVRSMAVIRARWRSLYFVLLWTVVTTCTIICLYPTGTVQRSWNSDTCGVTSAYLIDDSYWKVSVRSASVAYESVELEMASKYSKKLLSGCTTFIGCGKSTFPCAPNTAIPIAKGTGWPYDALCTILTVVLLVSIPMLINCVNHAKHLWMVRYIGQDSHVY